MSADMPLDDSGSVVPGLIDHLSPSAMGTYMRCPRQYWYSYVMGIKIPPGKNLIQGLAFHKAAELGMVEKIETEEPPTVDDSMDRARDEAHRLIKEPNDLKKSEQPEVVDNSVRFARAWAGTAAKTIKPLEVERSFSVKIAGVKVVGRIDLIEEDKSPTDWKTTARAPTRSDLLLAPQTLIYPLVCADADVMTYRYFVGLKASVNRVDIDIRGDELERARALASEAVLDIAEAVRLGVFPRRTEGWHCSKAYCGYYERCMAGKDHP